MDGGQKVWAPHPVEGYQLGLIVDVGTDTLTVQPLAASEQVSCLKGEEGGGDGMVLMSVLESSCSIFILL